MGSVKRLALVPPTCANVTDEGANPVPGPSRSYSETVGTFYISDDIPWSCSMDWAVGAVATAAGGCPTFICHVSFLTHCLAAAFAAALPGQSAPSALKLQNHRHHRTYTHWHNAHIYHTCNTVPGIVLAWWYRRLDAGVVVLSAGVTCHWV